MKNNFSRRDFLRLTGMVALNGSIPSFFRYFRPIQSAPVGQKNVLIIVFDAFSAYNMSLHGYSRKTTPNIDRLAQHAIVYHNHFAGGNFSTPGTASLLTGTLPWLHRAFKIARTVDQNFVNKNLFSAFNDYYRIAYSHNPLVTALFDQFSSNLDEYVPLNQLLITDDSLIDTLFKNDSGVAAISWFRVMKKAADGSSYALVLPELYKYYRDSKIRNIAPLFPLGVPAIRGDNYFTLEQAVDWLGGQIEKAPQPFLGYFHFMPPHDPYNTSRDFYNRFQGDGLKWIRKPPDIFTPHSFGGRENMMSKRKRYDEFILYVDDQFRILMERLESSGLLKDTWVILTSDHGELFERGFVGHGSPALYQGVVRVPLMIFEPGRNSRADVYSLTSAVDVLPTLLQVVKGQKADWSDGAILPPFSDQSPDPDRKIYTMKVLDPGKHAPITNATLAQIKADYKLIYYFGYDELKEGQHVELYDIRKDPEELIDLYPSEKVIGGQLLDELKSKLMEMNRPYL
jgi:arylsulfatase A-like enzyme